MEAVAMAAPFCADHHGRRAEKTEAVAVGGHYPFGRLPEEEARDQDHETARDQCQPRLAGERDEKRHACEGDDPAGDDQA